MAIFGHEIVYFRFDFKFVFVLFSILKHVLLFCLKFFLKVSFHYGSSRPPNSSY